MSTLSPVTCFIRYEREMRSVLREQRSFTLGVAGTLNQPSELAPT